ncbi:TPM domain-containing protein [Arundinibacter roseus]|uniref:TPM domain-containing protein n=1 Tax=Arundinibacter roseus TaxID=2070510 RepID=A0A4R4KKN7_9BACT|nr:TPM domain-containing protein [Arundinibacter roseus]TDB68824.1 TPM domain-containing protein [Arundinibacter roseus]
MSKAHPLFGKEEQDQIVQAIQEAEKQTSGEIKVHIEQHCPDADVMERAKVVFGELGMHTTQFQNGVLFYLAYQDRKFAVLGDKGIYEKVPHDFWESTKDKLRLHFKASEFSIGLCEGILEAGLQLKKYFPYQSDDTNELPDDVSFG